MSSWNCCVFVCVFCSYVYRYVCLSYRLCASEKLVYVHESYIQICFWAGDECKKGARAHLHRVRGAPWARQSWLDGYKNKLCACCWFPSACSPAMTTGPSSSAQSSSRTNSLGWNDSPAAKRNQQRDQKTLAFTHNVFCLGVMCEAFMVRDHLARTNWFSLYCLK